MDNITVSFEEATEAYIEELSRMTKRALVAEVMVKKLTKALEAAQVEGTMGEPIPQSE